MEEHKKPINLTMVMMTFLALAVVFSTLSYGYGQASAEAKYRASLDEISENFGNLCLERGYDRVVYDSSFGTAGLFDLIGNTTSNITTNNTMSNTTMNVTDTGTLL